MRFLFSLGLFDELPISFFEKNFLLYYCCNGGKGFELTIGIKYREYKV